MTADTAPIPQRTIQAAPKPETLWAAATRPPPAAPQAKTATISSKAVDKQRPNKTPHSKVLHSKALHSKAQADRAQSKPEQARRIHPAPATPRQAPLNLAQSQRMPLRKAVELRFLPVRKSIKTAA
jgi:hypothetical protein